MDIRNILQDCLILLFFLPVHGLFDDDYEDAAAFGRCPWIRNKLKNGRVRYRYKGRVAKFLCDSGFELAGKRSSTCVRGQWSNPLPVCVARGCNRVPTIANGRVTEMYRGALLVYDCNPGYTLAGDSSIHCDGRRWNATPPSCAVSIQDPETHCDFETYDLCGWTHDPIHDFDWRRNQFATPSGHVGTGPSYDHTFGENKAGYYLYIEASSPRKPNDVARLFSPVYHPEESGGCFIFWYHMYGTNTGGLRVYLKPESYVFNELSPKWHEFGDHGNQWLRGNISVPVFRENFQIVIEGVRGDGYMGDTAIDDVYLTKQDCESMENETDSHSEDSTDSCRGRCRGSIVADACGCNENCHAADNCCNDYLNLCFDANDTLVPDTDEGDYYGKSSSLATFSSTLPETTEGTIQTSSAKLYTEPPKQFSTTLSSSTASSSNSPTMSSLLPVSSIISTEGFKSSSVSTTISTTETSIPERKPATLPDISPSTSPSTMISVPNTADTSVSSITEKPSEITTSAGATTLKTSPTMISLKTSPSTISLKTSSSTILKTSSTVSYKPPPSTMSVKASPSTTTSFYTSPSSTNSVRTSSMATTTENLTSTSQSTSASIMQLSTKSTIINSTANQTLTSKATQNSKDESQKLIYRTAESITFSKLIQPDTTTIPTSSDIPVSSTPRYNLRPRKTTTISSTTTSSKNSPVSTASTFISTTTSKAEASSIPVAFITTSQTRSSTKPLVFTARIFTKKTTEVATTISSIIQTNTTANSIKTTKLRFPSPHMLTFPSMAPTTADSFEMVSSKGSDSSATVITVVIIILLCVIGGTVFYIKKYKGKRQSKLDDDSEMRFLPDSDYMDYSDASALDKIMVK